MRRKKTIPDHVRLAVITRDNGRCRACGIADRDALQCDHIIPESKGGTDRLSNLQALCGVCNNRKQNTYIGELPILPAVEGFGDYAEVMYRRGVFMETLSAARTSQYARLAEMVVSMRDQGTKGYKIRQYLERMADSGVVDKVMRETRQ